MQRAAEEQGRVKLEEIAQGLEAKMRGYRFLTKITMWIRLALAHDHLIIRTGNIKADIDNIIDRKQAEEAQEIAALNLAKYRSLLSICSFAFEYFDLFGKYS